MIDARIQHRVPMAGRDQSLSLDLHLRMEPGISTLLGAHASGKTLLFECLTGIQMMKSGRILVDDQILFDSGAQVNLPVGRRPVSLVPQANCLFPHLTLRQNLQFAAQVLPAREAALRVAELLDHFGLKEVAERRPDALHTAEHRVGMIAQALVRSPRALLVDTIPDEWDSAIRLQLFDILRELAKEQRIPILVATRRLEDCFEVGGSMMVLHEGQILQQGSPSDVVRKPASITVAELFGEDLLIPAEIVFQDPQNKLSRLSVLGAEIPGPYFAGHFKGSHVTLCVAPRAVECLPRVGEICFPGHVPLVLRRAVHRAQGVRLYFEEGVTLELPEAPQQAVQPGKRWQMGIPPSAIRIL